MSKKLSTLLLLIAFLLSSVTAFSVALAIYALIDDKVIALIFAGAAVLLDVFKYLAWPVAVRVLTGARRYLMIACALMLSCVSCFATYERFYSSIDVSKISKAASDDVRAGALSQAVKKDFSLIDQLDKQAQAISQQAMVMREKGMVSKALELETSALARIDRERSEALVRIDESSRELTDIKSQVAKAASLPAFLAQLLCVFFAVCLELVPALILTSLLSCKKPMEPAPKISETGQELTKTDSAQVAESQAESRETPETDGLLAALIEQAKAAGPGSSVKVKDFAKAVKVGNVRAIEAFKNAEKLGFVRKTHAGYIAS
ncbi:hypothetical protein [Stutzerimonas kunmingensis]|uniref:Uncharacterized protein n=1 Tax=Stutzerimonas kunmingensis TaxID=1211807 RepID=A0A9X1N679_9GAMM|nr:hypothetical protein [Stutzerimonas kunmingensis]MCD1608641.1 hypothetical protein [Stutzerimonas kunmingensis]